MLIPMVEKAGMTASQTLRGSLSLLVPLRLYSYITGSYQLQVKTKSHPSIPVIYRSLCYEIHVLVKLAELEDMNETSRARSDNKCHQQWNGPKSFMECLCSCCMSLECCALEAYFYGTQLWLRSQKLSDLVLRCLMHPGLHGTFLALALKIPRL